MQEGSVNTLYSVNLDENLLPMELSKISSHTEKIILLNEYPTIKTSNQITQSLIFSINWDFLHTKSLISTKD